MPVSVMTTAAVPREHGSAKMARGDGLITILVGDGLYIQAWYRDTGFPPPGNANLTNGVGPIVVVP